ncbi:hypothetical protein FGW37_24620 [Streptomyces rectiverticillatus]|uniref:hypothetical protein n=1 Tax=Streptomyces rectiverticillatus TaxID=173860 RepID=UPI0015C36F84|nr:hypothetical protein [Streptomyces rectiverticillatus]QLE74355.1 hypothetical protein FGW37_24620 [Streptomyces rectiverticillatus]
MDDKGESEAKQKNKRLELSLAQVAGSALAAVIAALLAGKLGVYGTVIGAGVVSVVATSGGSVFQHLFKRTGEQLREATTQAAKPKLRQVPVQDAGRAVGRAAAAAQDPARRAAQDDATRMLPQADATQMLPAADDAATRLLHAASRSPEPGGAYAGAHPGARADEHSFAYTDTDTYTPATTHGTRTRGWKRPLIAAGAVFVLAMGTVTAVELVKGSSADGGKGTTVSQIFDGGKSQKKQDPPPERSPGPERSHDGGEERGTGGDSGPSPDPDASRQGGDTGKQSPDPSTSPSSGGSTPSTKPDPTPNPSTSQGGGTGGDDKGGGGTGGSTAGQGTTGGGTTPKPPAQGQNAAAGAGSPAAGAVS